MRELKFANVCKQTAGLLQAVSDCFGGVVSLGSVVKYNEEVFDSERGALCNELW
jgi:hypothetical protein